MTSYVVKCFSLGPTHQKNLCSLSCYTTRSLGGTTFPLSNLILSLSDNLLQQPNELTHLEFECPVIEFPQICIFSVFLSLTISHKMDANMKFHSFVSLLLVSLQRLNEMTNLKYDVSFDGQDSNQAIYKFVVNNFSYLSPFFHKEDVSFKFILIDFDVRGRHVTGAWGKYTDMLIRGRRCRLAVCTTETTTDFMRGYDTVQPIYRQNWFS